MLVIFFLLLGTICVYYFWKSKVRLPYIYIFIYYFWKSKRMLIHRQRDGIFIRLKMLQGRLNL